MRATGIVRRIDELGRVVIPKEVRKIHRWRDGDAIEIFTEKEGRVVLQKYGLPFDIKAVAQDLCKSASETTGYNVMICDRDYVIAINASCKDAKEGTELSGSLSALLEDKTHYVAKNKNSSIFLFKDEKDTKISGSQYIYPVIIEGHISCAVVLFSKKEGASEVADIVAQTLERYITAHLGG